MAGTTGKTKAGIVAVESPPLETPASCLRILNVPDIVNKDVLRFTYTAPALLLLSCMLTYRNNTMMPDAPASIKYIALGDSYTIGTGASEEEAWPALLVKHLADSGMDITLTHNPAHNGFTSQDVVDRELPILNAEGADVVTLLIGVNDWVQGVDATTFQGNLSYIIDRVQAKLTDKHKLVLITIPDFGVTPSGGRYAYGRDISSGIAAFNTIIKDESVKHGLICIDIYDISKRMKDDPSLIASDGLHPSGKEYAEWEKLIFPKVQALLK